MRTTRTYIVALHERYVYRMSVVATSALEVTQKVEAFYAQQRTPQVKYQKEGLTATFRCGAIGISGTPVAATRSTYSVKFREAVDYDVEVVASSIADAKQKVKAFYGQQRKPKTQCRQEGLTATLQEKLVFGSQPIAGPSAQAKARAAARDR